MKTIDGSGLVSSETYAERFGLRNPEGVRILDMCTAADLAISNTFFTKADSRLITNRSGNARSKVDYILVRQRELKFVRDTKVTGGEECAPQHKLLVCDIILQSRPQQPRTAPARRRIWKLQKPEVSEEYRKLVQESIRSFSSSDDVNGAWNNIKSCLLNSCDTACGWTSGQSRHKETWWWNNVVDKAVKEKRRLWKAWQNGESKERYLAAKREAKSVVYAAKKSAQEQKFSNLENREGRNFVFKLAQKLKNENQDVVGDKCVKDDDGKLAFDDHAKLNAWKSHYERLLNVEFPWDKDSLARSSHLDH